MIGDPAAQMLFVDNLIGQRLHPIRGIKYIINNRIETACGIIAIDGGGGIKAKVRIDIAELPALIKDTIAIALCPLTECRCIEIPRQQSGKLGECALLIL